MLEANRLGCDIIGYDINPMAYWIVHQEIASLDLHAYREAADKLVAWLENKIGSCYRTQCLYCSAPDASNSRRGLKCLNFNALFFELS